MSFAISFNLDQSKILSSGKGLTNEKESCKGQVIKIFWTQLSLFFSLTTFREQEGHDGPVSLRWLTREIPSYQALQYLGIGVIHRPLTRTKIGSHSSYV